MQKERSRTGLFMTELILALLFFSIAAAVCLQVYAAAGRMTERSETLKLALNSTENVIQLLKAGEGITGLAQYDPWLEEGDPLVLYYDGEGAPCAVENAVYSMELRLEDTDGLQLAELTSRDLAGEEIYSVTAEWAQMPQ